METTALKTIDTLIPFDRQELARLEELAAACGLQNISEQGQFSAAFAMANALSTLRNSITTEMMGGIMQLVGTPLGFRTDRDNAKDLPPYDVATVKDAVIEATLRGARLVGNEFNIIGARCYLTLEFFKRQMANMPDLTDLTLEPGVPHMSPDGKGALVPYRATWKWRGRPFQIERRFQKLEGDRVADGRIPVRVNKGMGADAILGKAERKMRAQIFNMMTGTTWPEAEDPEDAQRLIDLPVENMRTGEVAEAPTVSPADTKPGDRLTERLKRRNGSGPTTAKAPADMLPLSRIDGESGDVYVVRMRSEIGQANTDRLTAIMEAIGREVDMEAITKSQFADLTEAASRRGMTLTT